MKDKRFEELKEWSNHESLYDYDFVFSVEEEYTFECKEEFIADLICPEDKNYLFIGNPKCISPINAVEEMVGIPLSTVEVIGKIQGKTILSFSNKFWFKNHINLDMFCCIFKTFRNSSKVLSKKEIIHSLRNIYFYTPELFWGLLNAKKLIKFFGNPKDQKGYLFSFVNRGLMSSIENKFENDIDEKIALELEAVEKKYFS